MKGQEPFSDALFSVAWAGEEKSKVWFDNSREYSEHWIHQQQIRNAFEMNPLNSERYIKPIVEILIRSVPVAYKKVNIEADILLEVTGAIEKKYYLEMNRNENNIYDGESSSYDSKIIIDCLDLCKLLSRMNDPSSIHYQVEGNLQKGRLIEKAIAIMAQ